MSSHSLPKDAEISHDIHFKMCKKIAQLTKVIYTLNTRNDDYDNIIAATKRLHEEQLSKIYAETEMKTAQYRQKIEQLTEKICRNDNNDIVKNSLVMQLQAAQSYAEERERQLSLDYAEKLAVKSKELVTLKEELAKRLSLMEESKRRLEAFMEEERLTSENIHKQEIKDLMAVHQEEQRQLQLSNELAFAIYQSDVSSLEKQLQEIADSKCKLQDERNAKLSEMQALFNEEMETLKAALNVSNNARYHLLETEFAAVNAEFSRHRQDAKHELDNLFEQMSAVDARNSELSERSNTLEKDLDAKVLELSILSQRLADTQHQVSQFEGKNTQLETENLSKRQVLVQQKAELVSKSSELSEMEASRLQLLSTLNDLTKELDAAKRRISQLEQSKKTSETNQKLRADEQMHKCHSLQQAYQELVEENKQTKLKFEQEMIAVERKYEELRNQLVSSHRDTLDDVSKQYDQQLMNAIHTAESKLAQLKLELESEHSLERKNMLSEKMRLIENHQEVTEDLSNQLTTANSEIKRLEGLLNESQRGLSAVTTHAESLNQTANHLSKELDAVRRQFKLVTEQYTVLQTEFTEFKAKHETSVKEAENRLENELKVLTQQLNDRWTNLMAKEKDILQTDLIEQKEHEKVMMLKELKDIKESELLTVKQTWQAKVNELLQQISELKEASNVAAVQGTEALEELKKAHVFEINELRIEMVKSADEYRDEIQAIESSNRDLVATLTLDHDKKLQETINMLKQESILEIKALSLAHKGATEKLREEMEKTKQKERDAMKHQWVIDMESLRNELELRFGDDMDKTVNNHQLQMQAAKLELERSLELLKLKEGEHAMISSELHDKLKFCDKTIVRLEGELSEVLLQQSKTSQELESKVKELLHVRSEATKRLSCREAELEKQKQFEIDNMYRENQQKTTEMIVEFNKSQQILKETIHQLQNMLEEAEERYVNREPRDEDLKLISQLRSTIHEHEVAMKQLSDEKRYFQMELVNRETNFNKVFNADHKVGLLNPLAVVKKPKVKEASSTRFPSSSSSSSSRLEPLAGSPLHDEKLNNLKPIPPTKKLVR